MASLSRESGGHKTVQVVLNEKRFSIRLGKMSLRHAEKIQGRIEDLAASLKSGRAWDNETAQWVADLDVKLARRLEKAGLIPKAAVAKTTTLRDFLDEYERSLNVKPGTKTAYGHTRRYLLKHFGDNHALRAILPIDAEKWRQSLQAAGLSRATIARRVGVARMMFRRAVKWNLIQKNPFEDMKAGSQSNPERLFFVDRPTIEKVIAQTDDPEWRLLIALARYGGFRTPSESFALRLDDVDFDAGRILVRSSKTEHHPGGESRVIPLFPELEPYLTAAHQAALPGDVFFINRYRDPAANLRTEFKRIIDRAKVTPWPRLWQNLRASRETELAQEYPEYVVCAWIGNSQRVARKHYLSIPDGVMDMAAGKGKNTQAGALQKAGHPEVVPGHTESQSKSQPENEQSSGRAANAPETTPYDSPGSDETGCDLDEKYQQNEAMGAVGFEPTKANPQAPTTQAVTIPQIRLTTKYGTKTPPKPAPMAPTLPRG